LVDAGAHLPEVGLGALDVGLGLGDLRPGRLDAGLGLIDLGLGLFDLGLVERLVDAGQDGVLLDRRAEVDRGAAVARVGAEADDLPGDLGAAVDHLLGLDRPGGVDGRPRAPAPHLRRAEAARPAVAAGVKPARRAADPGQQQQDDDELFHVSLRVFPAWAGAGRPTRYCPVGRQTL